MSHKLGQFRDNIPIEIVGYNAGDEIKHEIAQFEDPDQNPEGISTWNFEMSIRDDGTEVVALTDSDFTVTGSDNNKLEMTVSSTDSNDLDQSTSLHFQGILKATNTTGDAPDPWYPLEVKFYPQEFLDEL